MRWLVCFMSDCAAEILRNEQYEKARLPVRARSIGYSLAAKANTPKPYRKLHVNLGVFTP